MPAGLINVNKDASDEVTAMLRKEAERMNAQIETVKNDIRKIAEMLEGDWEVAWTQAQTDIDNKQTAMANAFNDGANIHGNITQAYRQVDGNGAKNFNII